MLVKRFAIATIVLIIFILAGKVKAMEWNINGFRNTYDTNSILIP